MYLRHSKEILRAIKEAPAVYVGVALTTEDVEYLPMAKIHAISAIQEYVQRIPEADANPCWKVRIDPADRSVWIN